MHRARASGPVDAELFGEDATLADDDDAPLATPGPDELCEQAVASTPNAVSSVTARPARLTGRCRCVRQRVAVLSMSLPPNRDVLWLRSPLYEAAAITGITPAVRPLKGRPAHHGGARS
jgi:hypothetical protein